MLSIRSSNFVSKAGSGLDPAPNTYRGSGHDEVVAAGDSPSCVLETHRYPHAVLINETGRKHRQLSPGSGEGQSHRKGHESPPSELVGDSNGDQSTVRAAGPYCACRNERALRHRLWNLRCGFITLGPRVARVRRRVHPLLLRQALKKRCMSKGLLRASMKYVARPNL